MQTQGRTSGLAAAVGIFSSPGWGAVFAGTTVTPGLTLDMQNWHTVAIKTQAGNMSVIYDGATVSSFAYQSLIGSAAYLQIAFKGTGSIDWVNVYSNGQLALQSDMTTASVTAVPEPQTYITLLAGLGLIAGVLRRSRHPLA